MHCQEEHPEAISHVYKTADKPRKREQCEHILISCGGTQPLWGVLQLMYVKNFCGFTTLEVRSG